MTDSKLKSNANMDMLQASKDMLGNNVYAIDAISVRNKKIKNLQAILEHQKIAFEEIEKRYNDLSENKVNAENKVKELEKEYAQLYEMYSTNINELKTTKENFSQTLNELIIERGLNEKTFIRKVEKYATSVGGKRGALIKLLFTPPASKFFIFTLFFLMLFASIFGWAPIATCIKAIFKIFF